MPREAGEAAFGIGVFGCSGERNGAIVAVSPKSAAAASRVALPMGGAALPEADAKPLVRLGVTKAGCEAALGRGLGLEKRLAALLLAASEGAVTPLPLAVANPDDGNIVEAVGVAKRSPVRACASLPIGSAVVPLAGAEADGREGVSYRSRERLIAFDRSRLVSSSAVTRARAASVGIGKHLSLAVRRPLDRSGEVGEGEEDGCGEWSPP